MKKQLFPMAGIVLDSPVRGKKSNAENLNAAKAKIKRVVNKSTEVMVKITGGASGIKHLKSHMTYISRNGRIELENEEGKIIDSKEGVRDEHRKWAEDLGKARANVKDSIHIVLSMPNGTEPEAVREAVRRFAKEKFSENYAYLMALHHPGNDPKSKQPHVHLTIKALGYDGLKLHPNKFDLQDWRELFAEKMREQGYDAEATPRVSRGIVEKGVRHIIRAIQTDTARPGRGKVAAAKIQEAADDLAGKPVSQNPFKDVIAEQHTQVRKNWLKTAEELEKSQDPDDQQLAKQVRQFVADMPTQLKDERIKNKELLLAEIQLKQADKDKNLGDLITSSPSKIDDRQLEL